MRTLWSGRDISAGQGKAAKGVPSGNKIQLRKELDDMQMSVGSLYRVHAACALSPTRSPSFAWVASKRLTASRGSRSAIHTVQAAEQKAAGSEPSKVNVKGQTSSNKKLPKIARRGFIIMSATSWMMLDLAQARVCRPKT